MRLAKYSFFITVMVFSFVNLSLQSAHARKKRVVVMPFTGPMAKKARAGFVNGLKRRVKILSAAKYSRKASKLRVNGRSAAGINAVCAALKCSALIRGRVIKKRRRYQVMISVYDGGTGKLIGRRAAKVRKKAVKQAGKAIAKNSMRLIAKGKYRKRFRVAKKAQRKPRRRVVAKREKRRERRVAREERRRDIEDRRLDDRDDDLDRRERRRYSDDDQEERRARETNSNGFFKISAALGASTRKFSLNVPTDPQQNRVYEGALFPEVTLGVEFYPLVFATDNALKYLGLGFGYTRHLSITTKVDDGSGSEVSSSLSDIGITLRFRYPFNDDLSSVVLYGFTGFGMRTFSLSQNTVLPTFSYKYILLGGGLRVPLGTPLLALKVEGTARPILQAGQEAVDSLGTRDSGFAFSLQGGVYGKLDFGMFYFAALEFLSYSVNFQGIDISIVQPNTPDLAAPSEGKDSYFRLWAGVGYEY